MLSLVNYKKITKARDLQSKTDSFLHNDLYHIIGMGNLSASQAAALNKLVKGITEHRTVIKTLAALPTLPNGVANTSSYKATTFGLKLENKKNCKFLPKRGFTIFYFYDII